MSTVSPVGVGRTESERRTTARTGAGTVYDPYPIFTALRSRAPVHATSIPAAFGLPDPLAHVFGNRPHFATMDYATTSEVLSDTDRFGNTGLAPISERSFGPVSLQATDGPEHRRYRMLVQPAFARRGLSMWNAWLQPRLDELIDSFISAGQGNLYFSYCARFPAYVTGKAFGVPEEDIDRFGEWAGLLQTGASTPEEADAVSARVVDYVQGILAARRRAPENDLISLLVTSEITDDDGPHAPSDEQILGLVRNIMPAGVGTTYRTLGIVLVALLERPELLRRVYADRGMIPAVIDETLRWSPPVTWMLRVANKDTTLAGLAVPAGSVVHACLAAANRDPSVFVAPDDFDPSRTGRQHLSFSIGPHYCIGAQVARMELESALRRLLDRLPDLHLDPDEAAPRITGLMFRMPTSVPARWNTPTEVPRSRQ